MAECKTCRRPLPPDAAGGICPACVMGWARGGTQEPAQQATLDIGRGTDEVFPTPEELNRSLPHYRIESLIGQGGMGAVYRGYQPSLDRPVAIKIMSAKFAHDPSFAERFAREARTMARLNHQNIVNVFDFGQTDRFCYLVMEFVDGVNLRRAMREGQLTAEQGLQIVPQVCEALQFAHDEGIIHRDIKPENILLDRRGRVKIADFGLAKLVDQDVGQFTLTGSRQILGTVNYMAPEQIEKPTRVDHRADIYSLGVVLYELLTGELPLGRFQLPGEKDAGLASLDQVVVKTLEKEPERRYQRASEVRTAVEQACSQSGFRPLGPAAAASPSPATVPVVAPMAPPSPQVRGVSESRFPRVPFELENPWHNLTVTRGLITAESKEVVVDYSKRDNVFNSTLFGESGKHHLAYHLIDNADLKEGWFKHTLELKLTTAQDYSALPTDRPGHLVFTIKSEDLDEARRVVNSIRHTIGQAPLPGSLDKPEARRETARRRLMWPAIGMSVGALINTAALPLIALFAFFIPQSETPNQPNAPTVQVSPPAQVESPAEKSTTAVEGVVQLKSVEPPRRPRGIDKVKVWFANSTTSVNLLILGGLWLVIGSVVLAGAYCMVSLRYWGWSLAMAIVSVVPIHPGALIGIPAGIVALVELSRWGNRREFDTP